MINLKNMKSGSSRGVSICIAMRAGWQDLKQLREEISKEWQWVIDEVEELVEYLPPAAISDYIGCSNS